MKTFIVILAGKTKLLPSDIMDLLNHGMVPLNLDVKSVKQKTTKKSKHKQRTHGAPLP